MKSKNNISAMMIIFTALVLCSLLVAHPFTAEAKGISISQARQAVENWLLEDLEPFGTKMGGKIKEVITYQGDTAGDIGYYLVLMEPSGWFVVPASDGFWPIHSFGDGPMTKELFEESMFIMAPRNWTTL